jgi:hypothetical protein
MGKARNILSVVRIPFRHSPKSYNFARLPKATKSAGLPAIGGWNLPRNCGAAAAKYYFVMFLNISSTLPAFSSDASK